MQPIRHRTERRRDVDERFTEYLVEHALVPRYTDGIDCYDDYLELVYRRTLFMAELAGLPDYGPMDYWEDELYYERLELAVIATFLGE